MVGCFNTTLNICNSYSLGILHFFRVLVLFRDFSDLFFVTKERDVNSFMETVQLNI